MLFCFLCLRRVTFAYGGKSNQKRHQNLRFWIPLRGAGWAFEAARCRGMGLVGFLSVKRTVCRSIAARRWRAPLAGATVALWGSILLSAFLFCLRRVTFAYGGKSNQKRHQNLRFWIPLRGAGWAFALALCRGIGFVGFFRLKGLSAVLLPRGAGARRWRVPRWCSVLLSCQAAGCQARRLARAVRSAAETTPSPLTSALERSAASVMLSMRAMWRARRRRYSMS